MNGPVVLTIMALAGARPSPAERAAESCGSCHDVTRRDWKASAHAEAGTNSLFRAGFEVEPRSFCIACHAPEAQRAEEGIGCVTCHEAKRDGRRAAPPAAAVAARGPAPGVAGHAVPLRTRDELRDPTFCRSCHEFPTPAFEGGRRRDTVLPMQSTYTEWLAYARRGGAGTCQSCHMPGGRHVMAATRDIELLHGALSVTVRELPDSVALVLASAGVGHAFPTGDLFRHLTVEVRPLQDGGDNEENDGGGWRTVVRIGRTFATRLDRATLRAYKEETANTSLLPGAPRVVPLPGRGRSLLWRVRYHYGSERDETRGLVPADALVTTLAQGRTGLESGTAHSAGLADAAGPRPMSCRSSSP